MITRHPFLRTTLLILAAIAPPVVSAQSAGEHWVTTWTTANRPAPAAAAFIVGQPTTATQQAQLGFNNQTVRMIVPVSLGGGRIRVHFSNTFGSAPLVIGTAHVGLHAKDSAITPGSDRALTFSGRPGFTVPPGAMAISDPVDLTVPALGELAVSVFVPGVTAPPTFHALALHTTYISKQGDATTQASFTDPATTQASYWISSVDVMAPADAAAIIAFGDSITDGARSTPETDSSWPSRLARRLAGNRDTAHLAILNQGIAGNRVLRDTVGPNALARFDADVLAHPGVKWLIVLEGINDIGRGTGPNANPADAVTTEELIAAHRQMIERAHLRGIKVMGATLTPFMGAAYYSERGEGIRTSVNNWIKTSGAYDAVIDFDAATRDANHPLQFRPEFDSGDHLHPTDAGYKAMADAFDLAVFSAKTVSASAK